MELDMNAKKEFLNKLVWNNYIEMIKRKDIKAIRNLQKDPESLLSLLYAIGASEELTSIPAIRESLEEHLKTIIDSTINALNEESDLEVERTEKGFKTSLQTFSKMENYTLEFRDKNSYEFNVTRNAGEVSKKVKGDCRKIGEYSKFESFFKTAETLVKKDIDENGFVTSKSIIFSEGNLKQESKINRNGQKNSITSKEKPVFWDGKPNDLNLDSASNTEFALNMNRIILKYPKSKNYYEKIVGKEVVKKVLEICDKSYE